MSNAMPLIRITGHRKHEQDTSNITTKTRHPTTHILCICQNAKCVFSVTLGWAPGIYVSVLESHIRLFICQQHMCALCVYVVVSFIKNTRAEISVSIYYAWQNRSTVWCCVCCMLWRCGSPSFIGRRRRRTHLQTRTIAHAMRDVLEDARRISRPHIICPSIFLSISADTYRLYIGDNRWLQ